eukprot:318733_1
MRKLRKRSRKGSDDNDDTISFSSSNDEEMEPPKKKQKVSEKEDDIDECDYNNLEYRLQKWDKEHGIDASLFDQNNYIYKLQRNRAVGSDDSGYQQLYFEIFVCDELKINKLTINKLKVDLFELAHNNNDWRDDEPILNIIDPDLYVYKHFDNKRKEILSNQRKQQFDNNYNDYSWRGLGGPPQKDKETEYQKIIENESKGYFIRSEYQWIATEFTENKQNNSISITSSIHNISPRTKYENIYKGIEHIFEAMLPLFNRFPAFKNRTKDSFQVIVKAQRYCIDDGKGYKGHWHKEGLTENIIIGGLYYLEKDIQLEGGNLKFRNVESYDEFQCAGYADDIVDFFYTDSTNYDISPVANINEGTAVVFDNERLVHRVKMLKNLVKDNEKRYRSFVAFFIVDPSIRSDITTGKYVTLKREEYAKIICEYGCNKLSMDIAMIICEYGCCGMTLKEAKEMRKKDIEIRKNSKTKGKWGVMHYGNSGHYKQWYKNGEANPYERGEPDSWEETTNSAF